ncbi:MAG: hypothetical protein E7256_07715 [Lachnospiraceae bacterium]|nr:hypothetical protein [Lachnospiraceae bacterium]
MGRYYQFSKKLTEEEAKKIADMMRALENVKIVEFTDDRKYMKVETKDGEYEQVMHGAVNICARVAKGCEVSFSRFAYDD